MRSHRLIDLILKGWVILFAVLLVLGMGVFPLLVSLGILH